MHPSSPKPAGLSAMSGEIWGFTRTRGSRSLAAAPAEAAGLGGGTGAAKPAFASPRARPDPPGSHAPPLSPPLVPTPRTRRKSGVPQKTLRVLHTMVLVWGAAGGQPAPCYRDGIQSPLFQGRKPSCAQHFNVCSVKKINIRGFFFFLFKAQLFEPREVCALPYLIRDVLYCKQSPLGPILKRSRL